MHLHWIDWAVVASVIVFFTVLATATRKYTQSTSDFLAANRLAGRYLLTLAEACESSDDAVFDRTAGLLHLTSQQINFAHLQALAWADHIGD